MKIAVIHGSAHSLLADQGLLLERMVELGHEVHTLAPPADEEVLTGLKELGTESATYPLTRGKFSPLADLTSMSQIKQILYRIKPDVVLSISSKPMTFGSMAARMAWVDHQKRIYSLVTGLGFPFTEKAGWKRRIIYAYTKYMMGGGLGACTGIIFRNSEDEAFFRAFGVIRDTARTTIIENLIPEKDTPADQSRDASINDLLSYMELI
ncbi:glycosyltransferase [Pseudodesulfovibrio sediminis]|nr:glycosyltransferase [Pseudodesulfovibrio sediminis]